MPRGVGAFADGRFAEAMTAREYASCRPASPLSYATLTSGPGRQPTPSGASQSDYNRVVEMVSRIVIKADLSINGRQAGALVQAGQQHIETNE
ncbi:hypothetical protein [Aeromicrobium sp. 179-A 4D2 NHS]|uniref:hypothetical protein n=1 Tax=Aeromicrobium sp. 179-A 4D2 NHS TaxID=3142375 RepID=UPI0039A36671